MDENALGFTSYWRNSLADAESGKGSFERKDAKNFTHWHGIAAGRLDEAIVSKFFKGEKDDVETVDVILRPKVYFRLLQHGKDRSAGAPDIVTPIVTPALLSREGFLYPTPATSIPRDLLEPLPKGAFSIGVNRPGFPGECFICELRLPDHCFRWKHNKLFLLLPEEYGPAFPAIVDCYTSPPT